jgi:kinesin family protein 11
MQGDLNLSPLGNPVANAGMMPRAITNLYQRLETSGVDFSVKVSYVELYNEELRDLLVHENPDQEGTFNANESSSLKIYDDAGKRGVFIQGLEEVLVKDAAAAIRLLSQGSHKRQVAATKFNDHSRFVINSGPVLCSYHHSRSHAVFSITVHVRESSSIGDDLLRTGKLNLVDLAGSENIGRSGAENKRAREAGMINQSLLSLGRVINALVEKSSYIPYRESKLTRILQDSLGGRTKTTIIATISPAHSNIEETLSTLEYALRAKSIRNRPEVNQRMSRNALLKDYVTEIERLKADLVSAREKNGMYLSNETWDQLSLEKEQMQMESEAAKKECASINSQLNALREEFEQSLALLVKRDNELDRTKQTLNQRTQELGIAEESLKTLGKSLQIETSARQAYQRSENVLDGVAKNLKRAVQASVSDLEGVFSKLGIFLLFLAR